MKKGKKINDPLKMIKEPTNYVYTHLITTTKEPEPEQIDEYESESESEDEDDSDDEDEPEPILPPTKVETKKSMFVLEFGDDE